MGYASSYRKVTCEEELLSGPAALNGVNSSPKRPLTRQRTDDSSVESRYVSPIAPSSPATYNGLENLLSLAAAKKPPVKGDRNKLPQPDKTPEGDRNKPPPGPDKTPALSAFTHP